MSDDTPEVNEELPLDLVVDPDGSRYFVARRDYVEPIGPGFWERS